MAIGAKDVIPLSQARSRLSEIADEVKTGSEKIITKNGESYVALIDANQINQQVFLAGLGKPSGGA